MPLICTQAGNNPSICDMSLCDISHIFYYIRRTSGLPFVPHQPIIPPSTTLLGSGQHSSNFQYPENLTLIYSYNNLNTTLIHCNTYIYKFHLHQKALGSSPPKSTSPKFVALPNQAILPYTQQLFSLLLYPHPKALSSIPGEGIYSQISSNPPFSTNTSTSISSFFNLTHPTQIQTSVQSLPSASNQP